MSKFMLGEAGSGKFYPVLHDALKKALQDILGTPAEERPLALNDIKALFAIPAAAEYMRSSRNRKVGL